MIRTTQQSHLTQQIVAFDTALGWCALAIADSHLVRLTFGRPSLKAAVDALNEDDPQVTTPSGFARELIKRIQAFANGRADDFLDVELALDHLSPFSKRVVQQCRRIKVGETMTYGELAAKAKSPRAARAVGSVMAKNRFPLIVPCHRVVGSAGSLGGYSAPDGVSMKRRLLALERSAVSIQPSAKKLLALS